MPSQELRTYLVHLNRHSLARYDRALARHAGAAIAAHIIARYISDWVICRRQADTSGLVSTELVNSMKDLSGTTYLIDTVNPEVLECSMSSDLLG
jgi:hypothetical protein